MKKRLICLLLCLSTLFVAAGCTEDLPTVSISPGTESTGSETVETPDDFYSQNGQGALPTEVEIPTFATKGSTEHLYTLELTLPTGKLEDVSFSMVSSVIHIGYSLEGTRYFGAISAEDGSLLSTQRIPYHGSAGSLDDGGYWIANRDGLAVTFYTPDGTSREVLSNNNSYKGSMRPNFVTVSGDGKAVVAGFASGTPFVLIDVDTKEKTRVNSKEGSSEIWTFFAKTEELFLFSGSKGSLLEINAKEGTFCQTDGELRMEKGYGSLYRVADLQVGLLLKGLYHGENALMKLNFENPRENLLDIKFGMGITADGDAVSVYNLRTNRRVDSFSLGSAYTDVAAQIANNGLVLISARKGSDCVCFFYDLTSAGKADGVDGAMQGDLTVTDGLEGLIDDCVDEISQKYGIEIVYGHNGNDFPMKKYLARAVTDPGVIFGALQEIQSVLSAYPGEKLQEALDGYSLRFYLCDDLYGIDNAAQDPAGSFTTGYSNLIVVAIDICNDTDSTLSNELSNVLDLISDGKADVENGAMPGGLTVNNDSVEDALVARANEIAQKYGIEIVCSSKGNDFPLEDYMARAITDPEEVYSALQEVDHVLSKYPAGMLKEAIGGYSGLRLYLCGDLYGISEAAQDRVGGFTTDYGSLIVVVMDIYNGIDSTLPHELSHVFDRRIGSKATIFFDWLKLWETVTPYDDAYLNSYNGYLLANKYTARYESNPKDVWFTDGYGRTFPTEDRARLMECMFGSETGYLKYDNLAYKARLYSYILRQCFTSCQVEEEVYWERFTGIPDENEFADLTNQKAA